MGEPCDCAEARAYRWYFSPEQIAQRLREELAPAQWENLRIDRETAEDMRAVKRIYDVPHTWHLPTHAELEKRRATPGTFPPDPRRV